MRYGSRQPFLSLHFILRGISLEPFTSCRSDGSAYKYFSLFPVLLSRTRRNPQHRSVLRSAGFSRLYPAAWIAAAIICLLHAVTPAEAYKDLGIAVTLDPRALVNSLNLLATYLLLVRIGR